jgi:hypothetical protein
MNIYILFWVKSFLLAHLFKYENVKTKHPVYILFKMGMKPKPYKINILVANDLQVKSLSHMVWLSFSSWKVYN